MLDGFAARGGHRPPLLACSLFRLCLPTAAHGTGNTRRRTEAAPAHRGKANRTRQSGKKKSEEEDLEGSKKLRKETKGSFAAATWQQEEPREKRQTEERSERR